MADQKTIQATRPASPAKEKWIITTLCLLGAIRVFLFNAAFPPFNNVDEAAHYDLVSRYSQSDIPRRGTAHYTDQVIRIYLIYSSPEYLNAPHHFPNGNYYKPLWNIPGFENSPLYAKLFRSQSNWINHETGSFPVYYFCMGIWAGTGKLLGFQNGQLFYWIRFLNVPLFALLIALSWKIAGTVFPDLLFMKLGLPLMVAFFPQDVFYSINSDAFSPLFFAIAFYMLLQILYENKSIRFHLLCGFVIAATFLIKISNFNILLLMATVIFMRWLALYRQHRPLKNALPLLLLLAPAVIPITCWLIRNHIVMGDWSASDAKIQHLGWTVKPLAQIWNHPIFTLKGLGFFLSDLTSTFWRGEFFWHRQKMAFPWMDHLYMAMTSLALVGCVIGLIIAWKKRTPQQRFVLITSLVMLALSVLFLIALSIHFDFGQCYYPSRESPYFTSGRLIYAVFIPFLIIFLEGFRHLFFKFKNSLLPFLVLGSFIAIFTLSEILISLPVFSSTFNWFHLMPPK